MPRHGRDSQRSDDLDTKKLASKLVGLLRIEGEDLGSFEDRLYRVLAQAAQNVRDEVVAKQARPKRTKAKPREQ